MQSYANSNIVAANGVLTAPDNIDIKVRDSLTDKVCKAIVKDIVTGVLPQDSKLSEPELAKTHGVSRGPLREAMNRLEAMRLIKRTPNVGARVIRLSSNELLEIYQIREVLEGLAAYLAAQHMTEQQKQELKELLQHHQDYIEQTSGAVYLLQEGDMDFHYRILQGSCNLRLINILGGELYQLLRMYRHHFRLTTNSPEKALQEHQSIYQAIAAGDGELAQWLMQRHIHRARQNIMHHLEVEATL